jgi:hypothetical protein
VSIDQSHCEMVWAGRKGAIKHKEPENIYRTITSGFIFAKHPASQTILGLW